MKIKSLLFFFFTVQITYSQSVTTSPYSIYGLGSLYESNFGFIDALGATGIAFPSTAFINNKNPASLAYIQPNSFFFDSGGKAFFSSYQNSLKTEKRNTIQFSHLAFAFPVSLKSGVSVALKPYSSASYVISDYKIKIINSNEYYTLDANSEGGLNSFDISYGHKFFNKIAFGLTSSIIFGGIHDIRKFTVANSLTAINNNNNYLGFRFTVGNQFKINSTSTIGLVVKSPARINSTTTQKIGSVNGSEAELVISAIETEGMNFYLPLEIGIGINKKFNNNLNFALDYERSFWKNTNQASAYGQYTNQNKVSLGLSYSKNRRGVKFYDHLHYYSGVNYDSGFLLINNQEVKNIAFSLGIGIPLDQTKSLINVSYSYGIKGRISNDLIKENYHKIGVNLSLEAIWFVKPKYD